MSDDREVELTTLGRGATKSKKRNEMCQWKRSTVVDAVAQTICEKAVKLGNVSVEINTKGSKDWMRD